MCAAYCFLFFVFISLIADGPHHYHPACGHKGSSHISPVHALHFFLSRCKFSTLTTRQPMVEFYLLTFPRFPLRKKEHKSYFGKNRTHDFRTSRCAAYLLDHSGDERHLLFVGYCMLTTRGSCRGRRGLGRMMTAFVGVFGRLNLTISESKTYDMCRPIPRAPATKIVFNATTQQYRQTTSYIWGAP